jgi:predicted Zn-dependent protease
MDTHPLTQDRIAMVRARPPYPATPALADADWQALRRICGGPHSAAPEVSPPGAQAPPAPHTEGQRGP